MDGMAIISHDLNHGIIRINWALEISTAPAGAKHRWGRSGGFRPRLISGRPSGPIFLDMLPTGISEEPINRMQHTDFVTLTAYIL